MPIHGYPGGVITANPTAPTVSSASGVWTTEQQLLAVSQGNWPGYEYPISRSLRFNSADTAYLNRTPASTGNRRTWTWSGWVKRSALGTDQGLFARSNSAGSSHTGFLFGSNNAFRLFSDAGGGYNNMDLITSQVFRDVSSWYHIVVVLDTTQATASNRAKIYVNGSQVTAFSTATYPNQNDEYQINTANPHGLGAYYEFSSGWYFNGYMTEINFIDGQALEPSSFGLNDPETGVWSPKRYTGTYGTNGFYVNFSDNSNTTAATLGKDYSGNGNNWTPNNFSVTAGAGNDSLVDSPTSYGTDTGVGGEVRGNYCTLNSVDNTGVTITNGNLTGTTPGSNVACKATMTLPTTGKWYFEVTDVVTGGNNVAGIANVTLPTNTSLFSATGSIYVGMADNAVFGFALNFDALTYTIYKNNSVNSSGSITSGITYVPFMQTSASGGASTTFNFGQRAFAYTAPSGFKALCTQNLPTPTIGATSTTQANDYFDVSLWTGTGVAQSITNSGSMQPDFVWTKTRSQANDNFVFDAIRGVNNYLITNSTNAESTVAQTLTAFNSNGFSVGTNNDVNASGRTFVGWQWRAAGSTVSNTAGTITSTVSANTTSGFSIATFTKTGNTVETIGHGLGVAPSMVIVKTRQNSGYTGWAVYHTSVGSNGYLELQTTSAFNTLSTTWNNTAPTSTVFTMGIGWTTTQNMVAYCFAPVAGYSAFGSYVGNGSTDGVFVYTGFRPRYVMIKSSSNATNWFVIDTARDTYNQSGSVLWPNLANSEDNGGADISPMDFLSNGFKMRSASADTNINNYTYIYACFAENPFKYSLAR